MFSLYFMMVFRAENISAISKAVKTKVEACWLLIHHTSENDLSGNIWQRKKQMANADNPKPPEIRSALMLAASY